MSGPVTVLSERIRRREISVTEAVTQALSRLDEVADLNPVAWRDDERVLEVARRLDAGPIPAPELAPLFGVPVTVKDWIDAVGFPCSGEEPALSDRRPSEDATAVARLRTAGAIVVAKSNVRSLHGEARNPYDPTRTAGHSSSGDAIAVASGASMIGVGSDSGGSLRFPAHCTGVATVKPTLGRVPSTGHFPEIGALIDGRTVIGPLCRSARDLGVVLDVMAGPDGRDPEVSPVSGFLQDRVGGLRIGIHQDTDVRPTAGVSAMLERVAGELEQAGHALEQTSALEPARALDITQRYWDRPLPTGEEEVALLEAWHRFRLDGMQSLATVDAIVSPAAPHPAPLVGELSDRDWTYTLAPSLWGFPAVVVRAGMTSGETTGLPLGVQIVARPWREDVAIRLAEELEEVFGLWPPAPGDQLG